MNENQEITATLLFIREPSRILLGLKKRGFGKDLWNGFGGKLHQGETIEGAARREMLEESGVRVLELESAGFIRYEFQGKPLIMNVHYFRITKYEGEPTETEEMRPQWFAIDEIPFDNMWDDDREWMPFFLAGKKFKGTIVLDANNKIASKNIEITS